MSDWIRQLIRPSGASPQWHAVRDKGLTTWTLCGESFQGPIEVAAHDEQTERDGRCGTCEARLAEKRAAATAGAARAR